MKSRSIKTISSLSLILSLIGLTGFISSPFYHSSSSSSAFSYSLLGGSRVEVKGSTNINEFSCYSGETNSNQSGYVFMNDLKSTFNFQNTTLKINTVSLECGNEVMNKNLFETLKTDQYPFIIVDLEQASTKGSESMNFTNWTKMTARVYITLAGERRVQQINFNAIQNGSGVYHLVGEHDISLKEYNLEPPTALFGLVRVKDKITVKFDLLVKANEVLWQ